jgi:hypothetical protein
MKFQISWRMMAVGVDVLHVELANRGMCFKPCHTRTGLGFCY